MRDGEERFGAGWPIFGAECLEGNENAGGATTPR